MRNGRSQEMWQELLPNGTAIPGLMRRIAELQAENHELKTFGYTVAHDLSQPLTTITGYCHEIIEKYDRDFPEDCMQLIEAVYMNALRMDRILDFMLKKSGEIQSAPTHLSPLMDLPMVNTRAPHEP